MIMTKAMARLLYILHSSVVKVIGLDCVQLTFQDMSEAPFGLNISTWILCQCIL